MKKTHRLIRTSRRVSSETGVAIDAMIVNEMPVTRCQMAKKEILNVLLRLPPAERRSVLVDVARHLEK